MATDVLIVGGGGREHSLAWKLKQSSRIGKLYIAPGNGGTANLGENIPIGAMEFEKLADFVKSRQIGFTVCSMDDPLAGGIVDLFRGRGLRIWGPTKAAARIESSKAFSKQLMSDAKVPTAAFNVFSAYAPALGYVRRQGVPIVIKASGLALGKGVYVCRTVEEAQAALKEILVDRVHKDAGSEVVVEEFLDGPEISIHALCDGSTHLMFPPSQDHKTILEGDKGPMTGGMGVYTPVPWVDDDAMSSIEAQVVGPTLDALGRSGVQFTGLLYPGLKMTANGPKVLEFNARFGDPECQ
ncbi:MAG: phosphoribosylamine--glycine ligase, partial [bacterium]|nr:phosphoribosylamine--glycine ligase [bacterium]